MDAVKVEFSKGWPTAYDENNNEVSLPEWAAHAWETGHAMTFQHGEDIECGDCPWPNIPKVVPQPVVTREAITWAVLNWDGDALVTKAHAASLVDHLVKALGVQR